MAQPRQAELQAHLAGQAQLLMKLAAVLDDNSDDDLNELANDDDLRDVTICLILMHCSC